MRGWYLYKVDVSRRLHVNLQRFRKWVTAWAYGSERGRDVWALLRLGASPPVVGRGRCRRSLALVRRLLTCGGALGVPAYAGRVGVSCGL